MLTATNNLLGEERMNPDYIRDVERFGSSGRLKDADGDPLNVSHDDDIDPAQVITDGTGNVTSSPLIWRKSCFGRLERHARSHVSGRPWYDESGQRRLSQTPCDRCAELSPGVYQACGTVISERGGSNPLIEAAFDAWITACGTDVGPRCFAGPRAKLWQGFIQSIIAHGGWTNVNDDQVKLEALRLKQLERDSRNAKARDARKRAREARRGTSMDISDAFLQALGSERDKRAAHLKGLRSLSARTPRDMMWLQLPLPSCDRIADVWWGRELLTLAGHKVTGKAIAELMTQRGRDYGLRVPSLTTRVHGDLKRIARLEDDRPGEPIWGRWSCSGV